MFFFFFFSTMSVHRSTKRNTVLSDRVAFGNIFGADRELADTAMPCHAVIAQARLKVARCQELQQTHGELPSTLIHSLYIYHIAVHLFMVHLANTPVL